MALYTILFCLSLFMIALVIAVIKKMFFRWKEEHKIERMVFNAVERPAVSVIINTEKCVFRRRTYADNIDIYDVITKSEISLTKDHELEVNSYALQDDGTK